MKKPLVSIVILNYNGKEYLEDSLSSLQKQTYKNTEILLVDNNSTDGSVDFVREKFRDIKIIENKENLGFSGGNNVGIERSSGSLIALVNPDTILDENWLRILVNVALSDEKIGIVGGKIYFWPDSERIQFSGAKLNISIIYSQELNSSKSNAAGYATVSESDFVSGCSLLVKREVIDEIGPLDPIFFIYFEEVDWCFSAKEKGYKVIYVPTAVVYHKKDFDITPFQNYYLNRNLVIFYFKHAKTRVLIPFLLLKLIALPSDMIKQYRKYKTIKIPIAYLKANLWCILNLPRLIKKRITRNRT